MPAQRFKWNRAALFASIISMLLFFSSFASAFGISPAGKTLNYEPGKQVSLDFWLINSEGVDLEVRFSGSGALADSLFFENQTLLLSKGILRIPFRVMIDMPSNLAPGIHTAYAKITPNIGEQNDMFQAFVSPLIPINLRVPYPSKYADVSLVVLSSQMGVPVPIQLEFDNFGTEDISNAGGDISIFDKKGNLVSTLSTERIGIKANSFAKAEGYPRATLSRGSFTATADAYYDDVKLSLESNFSVGEPEIKITGIGARYAYVGEINSIKFNAILDWDSPVQAKAFFIVDGKETELPLFTLEPGSEQELTGFLDATQFGVSDAGEKQLTIRIVYASRIDEQQFNIRLVEHGAVEMLDESSLGWIIAIALFVLVFVVLFVMFWLMRHNKPKAE